MVDSRIRTFDALYRGSDDPWSTATRWYEARRRSLLLASLPTDRFHRAFEAGCGNGNVTECLAPRCDTLLASDASEEAVTIATQRVSVFPQVEVRRQILPADWPQEPFDLVVLSELIYFLEPDEIVQVAHAAGDSIGANGTVVACSWRDDIVGFGHRGDEAHREFEQALALPRLFEYADDDFILSGWSALDRSIAGRDGLR